MGITLAFLYLSIVFIVCFCISRKINAKKSQEAKVSRGKSFWDIAGKISIIGGIVTFLVPLSAFIMGTVSDLNGYRLPTPTVILSPTHTNQSNNFNSEFTSGRENTLGNMYYSNNGGALAVQDGLYFIGSINGLYRTRDFVSFEKILDKPAFHVNVVGDYIFFTDNHLAYRMRTDGGNLEVMFEDFLIRNMQIYRDYIYYINGDNRLFRFNINDQNPRELLSNNTITFFTLGTDGLIYIKAQISALGSRHTHFRPISMKKIAHDGSNPSVFLQNTEANSNISVAIQSDASYYNSKYYVLAGDILLEICSNGTIQTKFYWFGGMRALSVIGGFVYYIYRPTQSQENMLRISLENFEVEHLGNPWFLGNYFDSDHQINFFYPITNDRIVVTLDLRNFYLWDFRNQTLSKLPLF